MSYDAALTTTLDRIRLIVGDTSNDVTTELFPDETYEAEIAQYLNWKLAAADMAEAVAVVLDKKFTGISGTQSLQWADRAKTLRARAVSLRQESAIEDAASGSVAVPQVVTISDDIFFDSCTSSEW